MSASPRARLVVKARDMVREVPAPGIVLGGLLEATATDGVTLEAIVEMTPAVG